ncbi:XdhC family protein [Shewanella sp. Isolate11]|uniref:XdhC family protein n=1 Tax=Shewanella sp. Isolate11 TaxID=2908530 RepID=UPI001EFDBC4A|nr:XdhC family protein [Shewanella sp. Isolate11]MCG9696407.1 XdhC family protein [Shewanella sp. Isolate11]
MLYHIEDLLNAWQQAPEDDWVLVVVSKVQGSAYRKPGAMMLIHAMGKSVGLVSGGCLEADLKRHSKKALQTQQAIHVCYDASDESDASYQLGCGGIVDLMLIPLCKENQFAHFAALSQALIQQGHCYYQLSLIEHNIPQEQVYSAVYCNQAEADTGEMGIQLSDFSRTGVLQGRKPWLIIPLRSRYRIAILGGGLDAQPVSQIAQGLGWNVTVVDSRTSYARSHDFQGAQVVKQSVDSLKEDFWRGLDAVFIMHHNLQLDANALVEVHRHGGSLRYLALLGPGHRRDKVLQLANIQRQSIKPFFSAPAGLALGGELPQSVALSILSECHGVLHGASLTALQEVMA